MADQGLYGSDRCMEQEMTPPSSPPPPMPAVTSESEDQLCSNYLRRCPRTENRMTVFHTKLVEKLNYILMKKEVELVSDAETLTADEASDSSNNSWSSGESDGNALEPRPLDLTLPFADVHPRVIVLPMPQLEPMEIDGYELPAPRQQLRARQSHAAAHDDCDSDVSSENSSFYRSDDDEEIRRACQQATDEESGGEADSNIAEPSSGRVHQPELVYRPYFYVSRSQEPSPQPTEINFAESASQIRPVHPGQEDWTGSQPKSPPVHPGYSFHYWPIDPPQLPPVHPNQEDCTGSQPQSLPVHPGHTVHYWPIDAPPSPPVHPRQEDWTCREPQSPPVHPWHAVPYWPIDAPPSPPVNPRQEDWTCRQPQSPPVHPEYTVHYWPIDAPPSPPVHPRQEDWTCSQPQSPPVHPGHSVCYRPIDRPQSPPVNPDHSDHYWLVDPPHPSPRVHPRDMTDRYWPSVPPQPLQAWTIVHREEPAPSYQMPSYCPIQPQESSQWYPVVRTEVRTTTYWVNESSQVLSVPVESRQEQPGPCHVESPVELMDQDEHDSVFEEASNLYGPPRPLNDYNSQRFLYIEPVQSSMYASDSEINGYYLTSSLRQESISDHNPANQCNHCALCRNSREEVVITQQEVRLPMHVETRPPNCKDFSIKSLLSSD